MHSNHEEDPRAMSIRRGAAALAAVALLALPVVAQADNKHVSEAIEHAQGAANRGSRGHADAGAQHAEEALKHAQAAGVKNPRVDEGIKELKESVAHGK